MTIYTCNYVVFLYVKKKTPSTFYLFLYWSHVATLVYKHFFSWLQHIFLSSATIGGHVAT